jgi:SAM-dependent methyltransferase
MTTLRQFRRLARNWEVLGETDPMFGVLSDPTKIDGRWDVDEFFGTGREHVDHLFRVLHDHGVVVPRRGDCLDFGCGLGRLTIPLAQRFDRTVGVDVAPSMIEGARKNVRPGDRCEFVTNKHPDLRQFPNGAFDFVHSCLVLQHIPPAVAISYIGEFLRVTRSGGLVVFQVPAETRSEAAIFDMHAMSAEACRARVELPDPPRAMEAGERLSLAVRVAAAGTTALRHDIPGGHHICIGNHWLREDGSVLVPDDGRAFLPKTLQAGESVEVKLPIQAPTVPGRYVVEVDLVQEKVRWFAEAGSQVARWTIEVSPASARAESPSGSKAGARTVSLLDRLKRRFRRATPTFEMHCVPRADVERVVRGAGGEVIQAIDDNAAGAGWISYTYVCRRL